MSARIGSTGKVCAAATVALPRLSIKTADAALRIRRVSAIKDHRDPFFAYRANFNVLAFRYKDPLFLPFIKKKTLLV